MNIDEFFFLYDNKNEISIFPFYGIYIYKTLNERRTYQFFSFYEFYTSK